MSTIRSIILLLCTFLSCLTVVSAYKIDQSCRDAGIYEEVEEALNEALAMAQAGVDAIKMAQVRDHLNQDFARVDHVWDDVPPRPRELQDLIRNLFAHQDIIEERLPDVPENQRTTANYKQTLRTIKLAAVFKTLDGIIRHIGDPGPAEVPVSSDAVFYCDGTRYKTKADKGGLWALDTNDGVKRKWGRGLCSRGHAHFTVLAQTYPAARGYQNKLQPSTVQICQPLIGYVKKAKLRTWAFETHNKIGSKLKESGLGNFAQVDTMKLLAVTLLHEMTHTTPGKERDDVKVKGGIWGHKTSAYGWYRQKRLAKTLPYVDKDDKTACDNNADSIAFFALGCSLMSDADNPRRITDDGRIVPIESGQPVDWTPNSWTRMWSEATGTFAQ